ncbi:chorismate synthase [Isobaculum melis]|uniref:Chorismate synthase n=1 Tax=Isobaculum melis TaxID=142588 RepID=A0A1H9R883_9LACT|nr:chorismate synthase [Isobaculum melis]SER68932.1 chorismate synthase [Isobaculum melis]
MRILTAGESHGPSLTAIIEGFPAGLTIDEAKINQALAMRQQGYGRGNRMKIESDGVTFLSGIRHGMTLGSPITISIPNKDYQNWEAIMNPAAPTEAIKHERKVTRPRPGHGDLVGGMKYQHRDLRNVLERSSARETTLQVAIGALCKQLLEAIGIQTESKVTEIGGLQDLDYREELTESQAKHLQVSSVRMCLPEVETAVIAKIDEAKRAGDTLGGAFQVKVTGVPAGVGSYVQHDRKLDGKLAGALMSLNAIKSVSIGLGHQLAGLPGSQVQDEITWEETQGYRRKTNHLGGIEAGMSNGMPILVTGTMKPIPTLYQPLQSVDIETKEVFKASVERSDTCAVPACSRIAEHMIATTITQAILEQFESDQMPRLKQNIADYRQYLQDF